MTDDKAQARSILRAFFGPYFATSVYNRFVSWCGFEGEASEILAGWQGKDRGRRLDHMWASPDLDLLSLYAEPSR